jgi:hypothetical protein
MAGCGDAGCNCLVQAGTGVSITGSGTGGNPYIISADNALFDSFSVQDTPTVNLTLIGLGRPDNRFVLTADATVKLTALADVNDPQGGPSVGEVPVWVGAGTSGHWEFQAPPANPAGSVNVGPGITGTGASASPIKAAIAGTYTGAATTGLEVYVDSAGNLRALPPTGITVDWSSITGKPTTFPPSAHTHDYTDILNRSSILDVGGVATHKFYIQTTDPGTAAPEGAVWLSWTP